MSLTYEILAKAKFPLPATVKRKLRFAKTEKFVCVNGFWDYEYQYVYPGTHVDILDYELVDNSFANFQWACRIRLKDGSMKLVCPSAFKLRKGK